MSGLIPTTVLLRTQEPRVPRGVLAALDSCLRRNTNGEAAA